MPEPTTPRRSAYSCLLDKATRILAMCDHSEQELRRKLAAQPNFPGKPKAEEDPFSPEDIEKVIAWCYEHRWLDDAHFATRFILSRSRKGYGPQRIRQELQGKGISREISDIAMQNCEIDWQEMAREIAERKFGEQLPTEWKERAKVQRYLQYRGFYMEDIQAVYSR